MMANDARDDSGFAITREPGADDTGRFVLSRDGRRLGSLDYRAGDRGPIYIDFVEVALPLRGTGLGRQLVEAVVAWARQSKRTVVPICSYSRAVIERDEFLRDIVE